MGVDVKIEIRCKTTGVILKTLEAPNDDPLYWPMWWIWELVTLKEKYDGMIVVPERV